jgi:hypothetical protein
MGRSYFILVLTFKAKPLLLDDSKCNFLKIYSALDYIFYKFDVRQTILIAT